MLIPCCPNAKTCVLILCCFIFCKKRASQRALVRALHVSGHGPCWQQLCCCKHPWAGVWINKSVWGLWWAPRKFSILQLKRHKMPEVALPPTSKSQGRAIPGVSDVQDEQPTWNQSGKGTSPCTWSSEGAISTKIPLWHPRWMSGNLWLWGVRL